MIELFTNGGVAQLGERCVRNAEVRGSIPLGSTIGRVSEPFIVRGTVSSKPKDIPCLNWQGMSFFVNFRVDSLIKTFDMQMFC